MPIRQIHLPHKPPINHPYTAVSYKRHVPLHHTTHPQTFNQRQRQPTHNGENMAIPIQ